VLFSNRSAAEVGVLTLITLLEQLERLHAMLSSHDVLTARLQLQLPQAARVAACCF
jgi:hypothetical protein